MTFNYNTQVLLTALLSNLLSNAFLALNQIDVSFNLPLLAQPL